MRDFMQGELDKCREIQSLINQVKQLESNELSALSSRVDHDNNKRDIVTIIPSPRIPGLISPYLSKVSVPSEAQKSSRKSKMHSSEETARKMSSKGEKTYGSNHIIEMRHSLKEAKAHYENINNALINPRHEETGRSYDDDGKTMKTR